MRHPYGLHIDTPEAYQPVVNPAMEHIEDGEDLFIRRCSFTAIQSALLRAEESYFETSCEDDPNSFAGRRNALYASLERKLSMSLPDLKKVLIEGAAAHLAYGDDRRETELRQRFGQRLAATDRVVVEDTLISNGVRPRYDWNARLPVLTSGIIMQYIHRSHTTRDFMTQIGRFPLTHELIHGMFTAGYRREAHLGYVVVRNGVELTMPAVNKAQAPRIGRWLNEAASENLRQAVMQTAETAHKREVILVGMLNRLLPDFQRRLITAAIETADPHPIFDEISALLGPLFIDEAGKAIRAQKTLRNPLQFSETIVSLLPANLQQQGAAILSQEQLRLDLRQ